MVAIGPEQQRLTPDERSNLVAYLDGELSEAESRSIATKLTQSISARREVDALRKTWELLDQLPRPQATESLTQRTLTEVARLATAGDRFNAAAARTARRLGRVAIWVAASTACFLLGVALMIWAVPDPTARLTRDLSVAEHLDEYRDAGTIEFLQGLDDDTAFSDDPR